MDIGPIDLRHAYAPLNHKPASVGSQEKSAVQLSTWATRARKRALAAACPPAPAPATGPVWQSRLSTGKLPGGDGSICLSHEPVAAGLAFATEACTSTAFPSSFSYQQASNVIFLVDCVGVARDAWTMVPLTHRGEDQPIRVSRSCHTDPPAPGGHDGVHFPFGLLSLSFSGSPGPRGCTCCTR